MPKASSRSLAQVGFTDFIEFLAGVSPDFTEKIPSLPLLAGRVCWSSSPSSFVAGVLRWGSLISLLEFTDFVAGVLRVHRIRRGCCTRRGCRRAHRGRRAR
ncbi:hypothetical protein Dimus_008450 [Dionaea muscipula]